MKKKQITTKLSCSCEGLCDEIKGHAEAIHEILTGLYGDHAAKSSPFEQDWPENVREAARSAIYAYNRWWKVDMWFPVLRESLGLGALDAHKGV